MRAVPPAAAAPRPRRWRGTGRVFWDLALLMVGLGLATGVAFPFFALLVGVPTGDATAPVFVLGCLLAGLLVGAANFGLARWVVGGRLRLLTARMHLVEGELRRATATGDWSGCTPDRCHIPVDSGDEIGESAEAFNRLIDALAASRDTQKTLTGFAALLVTHLDLSQLGRAALEALCTTAGAEAGALWVVRAGEPNLLAGCGFAGEPASAPGPLVLGCLADGRPRRLDLPADLILDATFVRFRPRCVLALPVVFQGSVVAAILLAGSTRIEEDRSVLLTSLVDELAVALNNALSHENLHHLAARDPLTGVYNRRFGMERLAEEHARADRDRLPLGIVFFDVDYFKRINDEYGHLAGDRLLRAVAQAARVGLRKGDILVRYGGEEFLAILPGADAREVRDIAERLRLQIAQTRVAAGAHDISATVSMGCLSYPDLAATGPEELIAAADTAMYAAKAGGRDQLAMCGTADADGRRVAAEADGRRVASEV